MVVLVGHALLLSSVGDNVDNVTDVERAQEGGDSGGAMLLEATLEQVARARSETEGVGHAGSSLPVKGDTSLVSFRVSYAGQGTGHLLALANSVCWSAARIGVGPKQQAAGQYGECQPCCRLEVLKLSCRSWQVASCSPCFLAFSFCCFERYAEDLLRSTWSRCADVGMKMPEPQNLHVPQESLMELTCCLQVCNNQ